MCGTDGCQDKHNRLLNGPWLAKDEATFHRPHEEPERGPVADISHNGDNEASPSTEGRQRFLAERSLTTTMEALNAPERADFVALRTVSVLLKNGSRRLVVNAKTYINCDVAAELGLEGTVHQITVIVLNGGEDSSQTMPVEFDLQSMDGNSSARISAFTATRVTGDMQTVDWKRQDRKWRHLQGIHFPNLSPQPFIDMLIGIDYAELHYSVRDVREKPGEPVARLPPLGGTCIGAAEVIASGLPQTNFNEAYFLQDRELSSVL